MNAETANLVNKATMGYVGRIPVRNLWLLMLYSSELFRKVEKRPISIEENPDDIPDLVAEILAYFVERRLRRNLTYGYRSNNATLARVRGRIDILTTERQQLMARGLVACRFENLTVDTRRNRYVRGALSTIARLVRSSELRSRCRWLTACLRQLGVSSTVPSRLEVSTDRFVRHDMNDRQMVAAAKLAFELALPTESLGQVALGVPNKEEHWVRRLFERAIGGFYDVVLTPRGWNVYRGRTLNWAIEQRTAGIDVILPSMQTDIILEHPAVARRLVIDTKFTSILAPGRFRKDGLRSEYLYQIYAYLRSQVGDGNPRSARAAGLLLHPSVGEMVDETAVIQGHAIRFATVDLAESAAEIRRRLENLVKLNWPCVDL